MLTVWRSDHPEPQIVVQDASPDEWITSELLSQIQDIQRMRDRFNDGSRAIVSWDHTSQTITFHCVKTGNVIYRLTGEYDPKRHAYRMVWPD